MITLTYTVTPGVDPMLGIIALQEKLKEDPQNRFFDGERDRLTKQIMHTREKAMRAALIQLGWTPPPDPGAPAAARAQGQRAGDACLAKAERAGFDAAGAAECMLAHLTKKLVCSGEALVDAAKRAGFRPHDDRSFGPVVAKLKRDAKIFQVGNCPRRRGNGTAGGRLYRLCRASAPTNSFSSKKQ